MKIGVLQYYPVLKNPERNKQKVNEMIRNIQSDTTTRSISQSKSASPSICGLDFLVLPEMAFTGYVFHSREDISPFVEPEDGSSVQWAISTALELKCAVVVGFPLKVREQEEEEERYYNAQVVVDRNGKVVKIYRKHFLYSTDENWAYEGPSFESFNLPSFDSTSSGIESTRNGNGNDGKFYKIGCGICMDLNPFRFQTAFEEFEFGTFHRDNKSEIILCSMNWLTHDNLPHIKDINTHLTGDSDTCDYEVRSEKEEMEMTRRNIGYWISRLSPLENAVVVISNRIGREKGSVFCGNSCVLKFKDGEVWVLGYLGRTVESILIVNDTTNPN